MTPHKSTLYLGGLSKRVWARTEAFKKKCGFTCWHIEEGEELIFYKGLEPFSITEFKRGSETSETWLKLQVSIDKEYEKLRRKR